jgi:hypothetical protein
MLASADASAVEANGITRPGSDAVSRMMFRLPESATTMDTSDGMRISLLVEHSRANLLRRATHHGLGSITWKQRGYRRA